MPILVFQPENRIRTKKSTHMRIIFKLQKPKMKGTLERQQRKKFYRGTKTRITLLSQKPCLKERKFWKKNNKTKIQVSVRRAIICQHEAYFKFHPNYVYMYLYVGVCVCTGAHRGQSCHIPWNRSYKRWWATWHSGNWTQTLCKNNMHFYLFNHPPAITFPWANKFDISAWGE